MIKKQYTLYLENKPGELASVLRKFAVAKINIEGISVSASTDVGLIQVVVSNATKTTQVLKKAGIAYTTQDVALLPLSNEPGALYKVLAELATEKVNLNYCYATACNNGKCKCYAIISAHDLKKVEKAWHNAGE